MFPCVEVKTDMHLFIMSMFLKKIFKTLFTNVCTQAKRTHLYSQKQSQKYVSFVHSSCAYPSLNIIIVLFYFRRDLVPFVSECLLANYQAHFV